MGTGSGSADIGTGAQIGRGGVHRIGTAAADTLTGTAYADTLDGLVGNDSLSGLAGDDVLSGGHGADTLDGGAGIDTASYAGSAGVKADLVSPGLNTGDAAGDVYIGIENLAGSDFSDALYGNDAANVLMAGLGTDHLDGRGGLDTASYANSLSRVVASLIDPTLNQGDASTDSYVSIERLTGSAFDDALYGDNGANTLTGGSGDDLLGGRGGADSLVGGLGIDTASYAQSNMGVTASLATPGINTGEAAGDVYSSIENLTGTYYADKLTGDGGDNVLDGWVGADTLDGGAGRDAASYATSIAVTVFLGASLLNGGDAVGDRYLSIEDLIGSAFDDMLVGDFGNNRLDGLDGKDSLVGSTGDDSLVGGNGDDSLIGGAGGDSFDGGAGTDLTSYAAAATGVRVFLSNNAEAYEDTAKLVGPDVPDSVGDSFASVENATGGAYADLLGGTAGANLLTGSGGDDTLDGYGGADTFNGGAGTDMVSYRSATGAVGITVGVPGSSTGDAAGDSYVGIEAYRGSTYADLLTGNAAGNMLYGDAGDDVISGLAGNDTLLGDDGDDRIRGGVGNDAILGGKGIDTVLYDDATAGVKLDLSTPDLPPQEIALETAANPPQPGPKPEPYQDGTATGVGNDTLSSIENVIGSAYGDTVTGHGAVDNLIDGQAGHDELHGDAGNDTLHGGVGADSLDGGEGIDTASYAGAAAGLVASLAQPVQNTGDAAGDGYLSIENLLGSAFADSLTGDAGGNLLAGGGGLDQLVGSNGDDTLDGGAGADTLNGGVGLDAASYADAAAAVIASLTDPAGNTGDAAGDSYVGLEGLVGSAYADTLSGDGAANLLAGLGGGDSLAGLAGADTLMGGAGADTLNGGTGIDVVSYGDAAAGVVASLANAAQNTGDAAGDAYAAIEGLAGSQWGDWLTGKLGSNRLTGLDGADTLTGGLGEDVLDGGEGLDLASYDTAAAGVTVSLASPAANTGDAEGDSFVSIEGLGGSAYADMLGGDAGGNRLEGRDGADTLTGLGGDDVLEGGAGGDSLDGGGGLDLASYARAAAGITASLSQPGINTGDAAGDSFASIEGLVGSAFADVLAGNILGNTLSGLGGADTLTGNVGNDVLIGGLGGDLLDGGADSDTASYEGAASGVRVNLANASVNTGEAAGDTFVSIENLTGSLFGDRLVGDAAANLIAGLAGNDDLTGNGGNDTFAFGAGFGDDRIIDFVAGTGVNAEVVRFSDGLFADYADVMAHAVQDGAGTVITDAAGDTLTLVGVTMAALVAENFTFG